MHLKGDMKNNGNVPIFPTKTLNEQLRDIAAYFKNELRGAIVVPGEAEEDPSQLNQSDMILTIFNLVENCHLTNQIPQESVAESVLNGILTCVLCFEVPEETREKLVQIFANKLADLSVSSGNVSGVAGGTGGAEGPNKFVAARLRVLSTLFYGLDEGSAMRYVPFCRLIELAAATSYLHRIPTEPYKVKEYIKLWKLDDNRVRSLWRTIHAALIKTGDSSKASKIMVELLKTFTSETASEAREEAFQCTRDAVADPYAVSLDHLLHLKPVQHLKGQPIYQLLHIFVSGTVFDYKKFYETNADAVERMGLSPDANLRKIRLLTFLNICRGSQEVTHEEVEKQLLLAPDEVEQFIIDALKTRLISGKIDAAQRRFRVTTCIEPSFTKAKWQELRDSLGDWQSQVRHMKRMLASVTNPDLA